MFGAFGRWLVIATCFLITGPTWGGASEEPGQWLRRQFATASSGQTCLLRVGGAVACWPQGAALPLPLPGPFLSLASVNRQICGLRADGTLACWGDGPTPPANETFMALDSGHNHYCGLRADGAAICWPAGSPATTVPAGETFVAMRTGGDSSCGLRPDGTALCWGSIGSAPVGEVFVDIAVSGAPHACGLRSNGTAVCWGWNQDGLLDAPSGMTFVSLHARNSSSCGLRLDGVLFCWGGGSNGERFPGERFVAVLDKDDSATCGLRADGTVLCDNVPELGTTVPEAEAFASLSIGSDHACGLLGDGSSRCWGRDIGGSTVAPVGQTFIAIGASFINTCALRPDGSPLCWGSDPSGWRLPEGEAFVQLASGGAGYCGLRGNGTALCWGGEDPRDDTPYPTPPTEDVFTAVTTDNRYGCGLHTDGSVTCWGQGPAITPPAGEVFTAIDAGILHACGMRSNGTLRCWGNNSHGALDVPAGASFRRMAVGGLNTCGLDVAGKIHCWGDNGTSQLSVPSDETFVDVVIGSDFICGQRGNGTLRCWGQGNWHSLAQLAPYGPGSISAGHGHSCNRSPEGLLGCFGDLSAPAPEGVFRSVAGGGQHACALDELSTALCWGDNGAGQLDAPSEPYRQLALGATSSCGLREDHTLECWGGSDGGLDSPPLAQFRSFSAGHLHGCGVSVDGSGVCWGSNAAGQTSVVAATYRSIAAGASHSCGILTDGTLACWGSNVNGESTAPPGQHTALAAGSGSNCAIRVDGTLACWGRDDLGQGRPPAGTFLSITAGNEHYCALRTNGQRACWGNNAAGQAPTVTLSPASLDAATQNQPYSATFALTGAYSPVNPAFVVVDGSLPTGLSLSTAGVLSGTPVTEGTFNFSVEGEDANGIGAANAYTLEVQAADSDSTPPVITANVTGAQGSGGWYIGNVTISWAVEDPESTILASTGCTTATLITDSPGADFICTATSAGGTSDETATVRRDASPPETALTSAPLDPSEPGNAVFAFTGEDGVSGVGAFACSLDGAAFAACSSPFTASGLAAGAHTFAVRAINGAGLEDVSPASHAWTIQADATTPVASPTLSRQPNANGWLNANVTVSWNWSDSGGINNAQCTDRSSNTVLGVQTLTATCADLAGNVGTSSIVVRVDTQPPRLRPSVTPARIMINGTGIADAGGTDEHSFIATQACTPVATSSIGTFAITCSVTDAAGNTASAKTNYSVFYGFAGFAAPLTNVPGLNLMLTTGTAPLRWQLVDANGVPVTTLKGATVSSITITCPGTSPQRVSEFASSTKLTNLGGGNYAMGWKPAKSHRGTCRRVTVSFGDGESHVVDFQLD